MSEPSGGARRQTTGRPTRPGLTVTVSSVISAGLGYVVLLIAARTLSVEQNAEFLVFWSALFGVFAALSGIQAESTRAIRAHDLEGRGSAEAGRPLMAAAVWAGAAFAALGIGSIWAREIFATDPYLKTGIIAIAAISYALHCAGAGGLAALGRWTQFSWLLISESVVRLITVLIAAYVVLIPLSYDMAAATGAFIWILWAALSPAMRRSLAARADRGHRRLVASMGHALVSSIATAVIVTGFATLLKLASTAQEFAGAAPLILAITITRAPVMIPLQALQGLLIARFVDAAGAGHGPRIVRPLLMIVGGGLVASGAAFLLGPPVLSLFGPAYGAVPAGMLAGLTFAAGLLAALTFSGTVTIASGNHRWFAIGWLAATIASVLILFFSPGDLNTRALIALIVGPPVGIALHIAALRIPALRGNRRRYDRGHGSTPADVDHHPGV